MEVFLEMSVHLGCGYGFLNDNDMSPSSGWCWHPRKVDKFVKFLEIGTEKVLMLEPLGNNRVTVMCV